MSEESPFVCRAECAENDIGLLTRSFSSEASENGLPFAVSKRVSEATSLALGVSSNSLLPAAEGNPSQGTSMGQRDYQEDRLTVVHPFSGPNEKLGSIFAVFDGHGGSSCSHYVAEGIGEALMGEPEFKKTTEADIQTAFTNALRKIDRNYAKRRGAGRDMSGSTGCILLVRDQMLFCGNVGDSRAVACVDGKAFGLSKDQKVTRSDERQRIAVAGGRVENKRLFGDLENGRCFGDLKYKFKFDINGDVLNPKDPDKILIVDPEFLSDIYSPVPPEILDTIMLDFIIIASDGIWDCYSNQEAVDLVLAKLAAGVKLPDLAQLICDESLTAEKYQGDNMTVLVIFFERGRHLLK